MTTKVKISVNGSVCTCKFANDHYIKVDNSGVWEKTADDEEFALVIPISDNSDTVSN